MIGLTDWLYILKRLLKSETTKKELRKNILETCLVTSEKVFGAYCVDYDKVWSNIILQDEKMAAKLKALKFNRVEDIISYYEEIKYKHMRDTYPKHRHIKG